MVHGMTVDQAGLAPRPRGYKTFSSSTRMKFIMLINVKMPTIIDIFTFISMIHTTSESLTARNIFIIQHISSYEQLR